MSTPTAQPTEHPLAWLRQIPGDLFKQDDIPLLGNPPPFAWNQFATELSSMLQLSQLVFTPTEWQWRDPATLFLAMGDRLKAFSFNIAPLPGKVWWVMPENDLAKLMGQIVTKQPIDSTENIDPDFFHAFTRFLTVEALTAFEKINQDKKLSPTLNIEEGLPAEACLCMDVTTNIQEASFHGRLFLSQEFRRAWKQRTLPKQTTLTASPLAENLDVVIHLEAGRVNLMVSEWKQLKIGDFLFLDTCSLDPDEDKGKVMLTINGLPYFRARVKQGSLKILEHPLYFEANKAMNKSPEDKDDFDDDFKDLDLESSEHSLHDDSHHDDSHHDDSLHDDSHHDDSHHSETDLSLDDLTDINLDTTGEHTIPPTPSVATATSASKTPQPPPPLEEIPLPVSIELGRVQMSIKKLLELQPGNILELDIHPETGVDLVVNGKRIARGELLRIGEALGVRIQELS